MPLITTVASFFYMEEACVWQAGKAWRVLVGSGGSPVEGAPADVTVNPSTGWE